MSDTHAPALQPLIAVLGLGVALLIGEGLKTLRMHRELVTETTFLIQDTMTAYHPATVTKDGRSATLVSDGTTYDMPKAAKPRAARSGTALKSIK